MLNLEIGERDVKITGLRTNDKGELAEEYTLTASLGDYTRWTRRIIDGNFNVRESERYPGWIMIFVPTHSNELGRTRSVHVRVEDWKEFRDSLV